MTSFIFSSKNVWRKPTEILFIMELYAEVSVSAKIISFDRDSYFWEKRAVMFAWNLNSQNCEKFVS